MTRLPRIFGALCVLKTIDLADRLPHHTNVATVVVILGAWLAASVTLTRDVRTKLAAGTLAVLVPVILSQSMDLFNQHLALIGWIGLWLALLDGEQQRMALRVQLSIVYGFGALAKLNPWFLSGSVLEAGPGSRMDLPASAWVVLAVGTVVIEGWLAVGLWFDRTRAVSIVLGVALHVGIIATMATGATSLVRMIVFNGLCVALYLAFTRSAAPVPFPTVKAPASRW